MRQGAPWEQLRDAVIDLIEDGLLRPRQLLPSADEAAALWSMSRQDALRAYNALERDRLIEQCRYCREWVVTPMGLCMAS